MAFLSVASFKDYRTAPQHITYTAFNKLETLIDTLDNGDTLTLSLDYGVDNQRRKSVLTQPSAGNKGYRDGRRVRLRAW